MFWCLYCVMFFGAVLCNIIQKQKAGRESVDIQTKNK